MLGLMRKQTAIPMVLVMALLASPAGAADTTNNATRDEAIKAGVAIVGGGAIGYGAVTAAGITAVGAIGSGAGIGTAAGPVGAAAGALAGLAGYGVYRIFHK